MHNGAMINNSLIKDYYYLWEKLILLEAWENLSTHSSKVIIFFVVLHYIYWIERRILNKEEDLV